MLRVFAFDTGETIMVLLGLYFYIIIAVIFAVIYLLTWKLHKIQMRMNFVEALFVAAIH